MDLAASSTTGENIWMLVLDIMDAFHQLPLHPDEQHFTVVLFDGVYYVSRVLVFGSASAPTVWGRAASWLGRSTAAILVDQKASIQIYVDDPWYAAVGSRAYAVKVFTIAVLWATICGFPLAWAKGSAGTSVTWTGAVLTASRSEVIVKIPPEKADELRTTTARFLAANRIELKPLKRLAGQGSFLAGLVPQLRPFLGFLWAAIAQADTSASKTVFTKQIRHGLLWLHAFASRQRGVLSRIYTVPNTAPLVMSQICTDASPWGIGAVLWIEGVPVAWLADSLQKEDLIRFEAKPGESAFNTYWEGLAVLVALRVWRPRLRGKASVQLRADSLAVLGAAAKAASKSQPLNLIMREIALDEAETAWGLDWLAHVPGVANTWPDALSRLSAPEGKVIPPELARVERTSVPRRISKWWLTTQSPCRHGPS